MRLFTAIDLPREIKDALDGFMKKLRPAAKIDWSPVENLHITTKFIGEWPEERLEEMNRALREVRIPAASDRANARAGEDVAAIDIAIRDIGWFPNERRPRVFWAGVDGGDALRALADQTERATAALGVPAEKRDFSPHLTLARIREPVPLGPLRKALESIPARHFDFGSFRADEFALYRSSAGRYTKLAAYKLMADPESGRGGSTAPSTLP
jgi:2'-5' RNA ligase